jgi:lipopolysaccharide/colanic/teichoic acid biosynthesis glycosyltransferase
LRWLERVRWQLGLGLLVCIAIPASLRYLLTPLWISASTELNSLSAATIAIIVGYMLIRRLHVFPGINAFGYVMPCFSAAFASAVLIMFMLRFEYSRLPLFISYILALGWFGLVFFLVNRDKVLRLAIVPGGEVGRVEALENAEWMMLQRPDDEVVDCDGVVVDLNAEHPDEWERFIADSALSGIRVYDFRQAVEQLTGRAEIDRLSLNTLGSINPNEVYFKTKQAAEWGLAVVALVLLAPVFLVVAIAIKCDSAGPVFFRQPRVGFRGEVFRVFKFRTMFDGSDRSGSSERHASITTTGDARITRVGRFLRRTRLDELPQFLNVVTGHMGWIGPRPEAVPLTQWYEQELPFYHYRHIVRPGITGWAQVRQGHVADVSEVREKLYYDFYYIKNYSFWLDVFIVMLTIKIVLTGHGAK